MIDTDQITREIRAWGDPKLMEPYIIIPTFSVYPSNSAVQAFVEGGRDTFIVSDGGGAIKTLLGAGYLGNSGVKMLEDFARGADVKVNHGGWIFHSGVTLKNLASAISLVTEFSREAAEMLIRKFRPQKTFDFRRDLDRVLERRFQDDLRKRGHFVGASNKTHTFDYLIHGNDNQFVIIDAVVPDSSSVNAAVVAHMDVRATHRPDVRQFIVYDGEQGWNSSDLALLTLGAPSVSFQSFERTIGMVA